MVAKRARTGSRGGSNGLASGTGRRPGSTLVGKPGIIGEDYRLFQAIKVIAAIQEAYPSLRGIISLFEGRWTITVNQTAKGYKDIGGVQVYPEEAAYRFQWRDRKWLASQFMCSLGMSIAEFSTVVGFDGSYSKDNKL